MKDIYDIALKNMNNSFEILAGHLDAPEKVKFSNGYVYRYKSQDIYAAILLKLARTITGLHAIHTLNEAGLLQEQAAIQRILDELSEDVLFLCNSIIFNDRTEKHDEFLRAFFQEEFDEGRNALESKQKRPMVLRKHIHSYINKDIGQGDAARGKEASRTLSKGYSGYIHAAAPHVMELYYGSPPRFHLGGGAHSSPLYQDHVDDMLNYFYRGILSFAFAAKAFGDESLFKDFLGYSKAFARESGRENHLIP